MRCPVCARRPDTPTLRCPACGELRRIAILMAGPPLCLKSTLADYLQQALDLALVRTSCLGVSTDDPSINKRRFRSRRHKRLSRIVSEYAAMGLGMIVDSGFGRAEYRRRMLRTLGRAQPDNQPPYSIVFVYCNVEDERCLKVRWECRKQVMSSRLRHDLCGLTEVRDLFEPFEALTHPIIGDPVPIIEVMTDSSTVKVRHAKDTSPDLQVELAAIAHRLRHGLWAGLLPRQAGS